MKNSHILIFIPSKDMCKQDSPRCDRKGGG